MYTNKYEIALKEKMLMKLEKDRLIARCENLDMTLKQNSQEGGSQADGMTMKQSTVAAGKSPKKPLPAFKPSG